MDKFLRGENCACPEKAEPEAVNDYYENKVAVVTGAASGIGLALSELLLSFGAKAVVLADLNAFHPDNAKAMDDYLLNVARKRRGRETAV